MRTLPRGHLTGLDNRKRDLGGLRRIVTTAYYRWRGRLVGPHVQFHWREGVDQQRQQAGPQSVRRPSISAILLSVPSPDEPSAGQSFHPAPRATALTVSSTTAAGHRPPVGREATDLTIAPCPLSVASSGRLWASHSLTVLSRLPLASRLPVGREGHRTDRAPMPFECHQLSPLWASHSLTVSSSLPLATAARRARRPPT